MRLCREWGRTPGEILGGLSAWELALFEADFAERPPLAEQLDLLFANLMALTYNANRGKGPAKAPKDFLLFTRRPTEEMDIDSMLAVGRMWGAMGESQQGQNGLVR